jgi:hypothetical protein
MILLFVETPHVCDGLVDNMAIFSLKTTSCPPFWITFFSFLFHFNAGFGDVKSGLSHIKLLVYMQPNKIK